MTKKRTKAGSDKGGAARRRALFVEAYLTNGGNATQASIAAGYSARTAGQQGYILLKQPEIQRVIAERQAATQREAERITGVSVERTLRELGRIAYMDPRRLVDEKGNLKALSELDDDTAAAVASVEVEELFEGRGEDRRSIGVVKKVKFWDKNSGIEKAMKHLGQFEKDNAQKPANMAPVFNIVGVTPK